MIESQVHHSLVAAENALALQSRKHSDGWGVAYYIADAPHVIKSTAPAIEDHIFRRVSGVVASETVVAHLRKATTGSVNILNAHPFQFGNWIFAHNGQVHNFEQSREALFAEVAPNLRRYVLGDTDSEILFYLFLTYLTRLTDIHRRGTPLEVVTEALASMIQKTRELSDGEDPETERSKMTFIVTDGHTLVGARSNMPLRYSTYKSRCPDRGNCPFLAHVCESPATLGGRVNHLVIASEDLSGANIWTEMAEDTFVGVDWRMSFFKGSL